MLCPTLGGRWAEGGGGDGPTGGTAGGTAWSWGGFGVWVVLCGVDWTNGLEPMVPMGPFQVEVFHEPQQPSVVMEGWDPHRPPSRVGSALAFPKGNGAAGG